MIKANELRIGNWINYKSVPTSVTMVGQYGIQSKTEDTLINAKFSTPDLKPIPLTPEILYQCGFELFPWGWVSNVANKRSLRITAFHFLFEREGQTSLKIESLHQLQNLFFALTGEDLEVSLK